MKKNNFKVKNKFERKKHVKNQHLKVNKQYFLVKSLHKNFAPTTPQRLPFDSTYHKWPQFSFFCNAMGGQNSYSWCMKFIKPQLISTGAGIDIQRKVKRWGNIDCGFAPALWEGEKSLCSSSSSSAPFYREFISFASSIIIHYKFSRLPAKRVAWNWAQKSLSSSRKALSKMHSSFKSFCRA